MAQNLGFARGGTSSWADDDEADLQPLPIAPKIASTETPQPIEEEEAHPHELQRDESRRGSYHEDKRHDRRESYGHRREGHEEPRGSREPREERPKNPVPDVGPWKLFVGNLPFRLTEDELADFIGPEGIRDIRFPRDYENRPKGFAYVEFDDKEKLIQALGLDGRNVDGRPVNMDVALGRERERKPRDNNRFEKRNDRPSNDRSREGKGNDARRERPRLSLLPRSTSSEKKDLDAHMPSIFGEAKPRDESAYLERKKALELERKAKEKEAKEKEREAKAKEREAKAKEKEAKAKAKEAKEAEGKAKADAKTDARVAVLTRKGSRDDTIRGGRDRGRGGRRPVVGGRGRGAPVKEDAVARKSEPRPKRTEPPKAKVSAPARAKPANVFELLNDSDSSSD